MLGLGAPRGGPGRLSSSASAGSSFTCTWWLMERGDVSVRLPGFPLPPTDSFRSHPLRSALPQALGEAEEGGAMGKKEEDRKMKEGWGVKRDQWGGI